MSVLAIIVAVLELLAIWRWGVRGAIDRTKVLVVRIVEGPQPRLDYAKIARLEREVFGEERS